MVNREWLMVNGESSVVNGECSESHQMVNFKWDEKMSPFYFNFFELESFIACSIYQLNELPALNTLHIFTIDH